jgi:hypothetical protein
MGGHEILKHLFAFADYRHFTYAAVHNCLDRIPYLDCKEIERIKEYCDIPNVDIDYRRIKEDPLPGESQSENTIFGSASIAIAITAMIAQIFLSN